MSGPNSPPLSLHTSLSAGLVHAVDCGSAGRWATFLNGATMAELDGAHRQSHSGDCVLTPTAWRVLGGRVQGAPLLEGCVRVVFTEVVSYVSLSKRSSVCGFFNDVRRKQEENKRFA